MNLRKTLKPNNQKIIIVIILTIIVWIITGVLYTNCFLADCAKYINGDITMTSCCSSITSWFTGILSAVAILQPVLVYLAVSLFMDRK